MEDRYTLPFPVFLLVETAGDKVNSVRALTNADQMTGAVTFTEQSQATNWLAKFAPDKKLFVARDLTSLVALLRSVNLDHITIDPSIDTDRLAPSLYLPIDLIDEGEARGLWFHVSSSGPDELGLCKVFQEFIDNQWAPAHLDAEATAKFLLEHLRRKVAKELDLLDVKVAGSQ